VAANESAAALCSSNRTSRLVLQAEMFSQLNLFSQNLSTILAGDLDSPGDLVAWNTADWDNPTTSWVPRQDLTSSGSYLLVAPFADVPTEVNTVLFIQSIYC
jgi:hypothetical protein